MIGGKLKMNLIEYETKDKKKGRAADIMSVLNDMDTMERFNGVTECKLSDNWYALKRDLADALTVEMPKEENK